MDDLPKRLGDLLQSTAKKGLKLSVTPCTLAELKGLGDDFQGDLKNVAERGSAFLYAESSTPLAVNTIAPIPIF